MPGSIASQDKGHELGQAEADAIVEAQQEQRDSNAKTTTSAAASPAAAHTVSQTRQKALGQKRKQPSGTLADAPSGSAAISSDKGAQAIAGKSRPPVNSGMAASPAHKPSKSGSGTMNGTTTNLSQTPTAIGSKPGMHLLSSKGGSVPASALPGSASASGALPRLQSQTSSVVGGVSTSTRISLPPGLTQLTSLRSKTPAADAKAVASPAVSEADAEEAAASAAAAAAEAQLKTVLQQFNVLLHETLQRTKESVHKVTQFAVGAAAGQNGKTAARRLVVMVLDLIETVQMSKRVDLFYLLDSLLQVTCLTCFQFELSFIRTVPACHDTAHDAYAEAGRLLA